MGFFGKKKKPETSAELMQQVMSHRAAGQVDAALEAAEKLDALLRRDYGERDPAIAANLMVMGELLLESRCLDAAAKAFESARDAWAATVGENHPSYADALERLALLQGAAGRAEESIAPPESAMAITEKSEARTPPPWRTVRVFLSSTFRDMHAERDHLVKVTFPRLRQWCAERRLHLVDIDLRWGVTREDAENGKAIDICLEEIDGSRPFFIAMLGERYGWIPDQLPPQDRFAWHDIQTRTGCSITHLEIIHATDMSLAGDEKRRGPPCAHSFFYFRDRSCIPDPRELSESADDARAIHAHTFFEQSPAIAERLVTLKQHIRERFEPAGQVRSYRGSWDPDAENPEDSALRGRLIGLDAFGDQVEADLKHAIETQFPEHVAGLGELDALTAERIRHDAFFEARTRVHVRRTALEEAITAYVDGDERRPMVLSGPAGSGKSAVLAHWARAWGSAADNRDAFMIVRFIGASPASTNLNALFQNVAAELVAHFALTEQTPDASEPGPPMEVPQDSTGFRNAWPEILRRAGQAGRTVIVIDALDQLDRSGDPEFASWILRDLPPGVRLILSAAEDVDNDSHGAMTWLHATRKRELPEVRVPPLSAADSRRLLAELPSVFCKRLDDAQIDLLLKNEAAKNPLFLTVAVEELRMFGSFEKLGDAIRGLPQLDDHDGSFELAIEALFGQILDRLDRDSGTSGAGVVPALFSLLASARDGLSEVEIDALVAARMRSLAADTRAAIIQTVLRQMRAYLVYKAAARTVLVGFFHESFRRAVRAKYLDSADSIRSSHGEIAAHFSAQPSWIGADDRLARVSPNERKCVELPWQLLRAAESVAVNDDDDDETAGREWERIEGPLTDVDFIAAKCACGLLADLAEDYDAALTSCPVGETHPPFDPRTGGSNDTPSALQAAMSYGTSGTPLLLSMKRAEAGDDSSEEGDGPFERVEEFAAFVSARADALAQFPEEAAVIARNFSSGGRVATAAEPIAERIRRPWIARDPRPSAPARRPVVIRTFVISAASLSATPDCRTVAVDDGGSISVLDAESGERRCTLRKGKAPLQAIALSADGETVIAATRKTGLLGTLIALTGGGSAGDTRKEEPPCVRVWDVLRESCRHEFLVEAVDVAVSWDGSSALLATSDGLEVWDCNAGRKKQRIDAAGVEKVIMTPDARTAITSHSDRIVRVWDVAEGRVVRTIGGHFERVATMAVSPDGRRLVTGTGTGTLTSAEEAVRIFDLGTGAEIAKFDSLDDESLADDAPPRFGAAFVTGVAISADGRVAVSVGQDERLRVWDVNGREAVRAIRGPARFSDVAVTATGRTALTVDEEGRLRLWNLQSGVSDPVLDGHDAQPKAADPSMPAGLAEFMSQNAMLTAVQTNSVAAAAIARHGPVALTAGDDTTVRRWDMLTGKSLGSFRGHPVPVNDVAVNHEGLFVSGAGDNTMKVWDPVAGCLRVLRGHTGSVNAVDIAADGRTVLSGASGMGQVPLADHSVRLWDLPSGACLRVLKEHSHWVRGVAIAPDARGGISGSTDGTVVFWNFARGAKARVVPLGAGHVERVALSPDGRVLAAATQRGGVVVMATSSSGLPRPLSGHVGRVNDVAFDADGSTMVSAGEDGTLRVWDVRDGECLTIYPAGSPVRSVSPIRLDGRFVCGTSDGKVHMLQLRGRAPAVPVVTAARRFRSSVNPVHPRNDDEVLFADSDIPGELDVVPSVDCPRCGETFDLASPTLETIDEIQSLVGSKDPMFDVPISDDVFGDDRLVAQCPACGGDLRFNPFLAERPEIEVANWRTAPELQGRFHADFPDDIEILVHDGHREFSGRSPERVWVRVTGKRGVAWTGTVLNQPYHLQSVSQGSEVMFVASPGYKDLIQVTAEYLDERREWTVGACAECGLSETMSTPSELLMRAGTPVEARSQIKQITAPCPMCAGPQIIRRR